MVPYKYNTISPRIAAAVLDQTILGLALKIIDVIPDSNNYILNIMASLVYYNIPYIYNILMLGFYGQTIGKGMLNLKVVDFETGGKMSFSQAIFRELIPMVLVNLVMVFVFVMFSDIINENYELNIFGWIILFFPIVLSILWAFIEVITMAMDNKCRAIQDKISDTIVIRTDSKL